MKDSFDKTQPIPRVSPDMESQKTQILKHGNVRELDPIQMPGNRRSQGKANGGNGAPVYGNKEDMSYKSNDYQYGQGMPERPKSNKGKTAALFLLAFAAALFLGLLVSGYMSDQNEKDAEAINQRNISNQQLQQSESQQKDLQQRKKQLDQQLKDLEAKQKAAQSEADKLKGKNAQLDKDAKDKSSIEKMAEMVSGKDAKKKQEADQLDKQQKSAQAKVDEINQSIQSAKAAYQDVNEKLDEAENMRQKAMETKESIERAYNENKGIIDKLVYFVSKGVKLFF